MQDCLGIIVEAASTAMSAACPRATLPHRVFRGFDRLDPSITWESVTGRQTLALGVQLIKSHPHRMVQLCCMRILGVHVEGMICLLAVSFGARVRNHDHDIDVTASRYTDSKRFHSDNLSGMVQVDKDRRGVR